VQLKRRKTDEIKTDNYDNNNNNNNITPVRTHTNITYCYLFITICSISVQPSAPHGPNSLSNYKHPPSDAFCWNFATCLSAEHDLRHYAQCTRGKNNLRVCDSNNFLLSKNIQRKTLSYVSDEVISCATLASAGISCRRVCLSVCLSVCLLGHPQ